jgi:hypothetical protein
MKYVIEIASGGVIHVTKFHDDRFRHSNNIKVITHRQQDGLIYLLSCFLIRKIC